MPLDAEAFVWTAGVGINVSISIGQSSSTTTSGVDSSSTEITWSIETTSTSDGARLILPSESPLSFTTPSALSDPSYGAYNHRCASAADGVPPLVPNLPTASSSGDSYGGYLSSSTEGYSTNHTTPIDVGQVSESTPRPMLPPPPGMHSMSQLPPAPIMIPGPYKCDVPNCTAGTFQTQYLLK